MYRRILVGYDGSAAGRKAFDTALELSVKHGAELYVLSVARTLDVPDETIEVVLAGMTAPAILARIDLPRLSEKGTP